MFDYSYCLEYVGYILDIGIVDISKDDGETRVFDLTLKCHPAVSLVIKVKTTKGTEQDFKDFMEREIPVKMSNLFWTYKANYIKSSRFQECYNVNFPKNKPIFMTVIRAKQILRFLCNIEGIFRWDGSEVQQKSQKYRGIRRKRNAFLTSDNIEQECVIWHKSIDDIISLVGDEQETSVCLTNMKRTYYMGIKFETTTATKITQPF